MKNTLLYLWQLPQNLLALILLLFYKEEKSLMYKGIKFHIVGRKFPGGISLGSHALVKYYPHNKHTWETVKHEYGHTLQSRKWGWLYLVVIGLPSLCGSIIDRIFDKGNEWYYNLPWEKKADEKGGVERWIS